MTAPSSTQKNSCTVVEIWNVDFMEHMGSQKKSTQKILKSGAAIESIATDSETSQTWHFPSCLQYLKQYISNAPSHVKQPYFNTHTPLGRLEYTAPRIEKTMLDLTTMMDS